MAKINKSAYAILGVLNLGPHSGYEVKKWIEKSIAHFWQEGYGQIYPNLKKLVDEGLATVKTEEQEDRPNKKVYTITPEGRNTFHTWLSAPVEKLPKEKHEILLKLFFGRFMNIDDNKAHVRLHQKRMNERLQEYQAIENFLKQCDSSNPDVTYQLITVRSGILYAEAALRWCEETLNTLEKMDHDDN